MNESGLDPDTAERMLHGEPAGPPELAALLAAASARPMRDPDGEEAVAAAFREARSLPAPRPYRRRISALVGLKTAMAGLVLLLAGGVAVAATGQHSREPARTGHSGRTGAPAEPGRTTVRHGPSPRPAASRPTPEAEPSERPSPDAKNPHPTRKPHPAKTPEKHTPTAESSASVKVGVPPVGPRKLTETNPAKKLVPDGTSSVAGTLDRL